MIIQDKILYRVYDYEIKNGTFQIPEDVTKIGNSAFLGCESLKSINIPEGVTEIGDCAFYNCRSLEFINIPEDVTKIGNSAFLGCESLKSINIPEGVTEIGDCAFLGCESLKSINIGNKKYKVKCVDTVYKIQESLERHNSLFDEKILESVLADQSKKNYNEPIKLVEDISSEPTFMSNNDFNMTKFESYDYLVKISEINKMIKYGAITVDKEKLKEYKFDTTVMYDKDKMTREEAMKLWDSSK